MRSIQQWQVYFVRQCRQATPIKDKFVIVACFDPNPCGFFINTRITPFIANKPNLLPCEAMIFVSQHPFLSYDSWVDCHDILSFKETELTDLRGVVSIDGIQNVMTAVQVCPTLRPHFKKKILG